MPGGVARAPRRGAGGSVIPRLRSEWAVSPSLPGPSGSFMGDVLHGVVVLGWNPIAEADDDPTTRCGQVRPSIAPLPVRLLRRSTSPAVLLMPWKFLSNPLVGSKHASACDPLVGGRQNSCGRPPRGVVMSPEATRVPNTFAGNKLLAKNSL